MAKSDLTAINAKTISVNGTPIAGSAQAYGPYTTFDQLDADAVVALNGTVIQGQMTSSLAYTNIDHLNVLSGLSVAETVRYGTASTPASNNATGPIGIGGGAVPLPGGGGTPTPTPEPALTISGNPGAATVGTAPTFTPMISGGTAPYTLSLLSGTLPPGRTVNGSARTVTGTYTTAGTYSYVLRATDSANPAATADLTVNVTVSAAGMTDNITGAFRLAYPNDSQSLNSTNTARREHYASLQGAITNLRPRFMWNFLNSGGVTGSGAAASLKHSIEYPEGVIHPVTWNGVRELVTASNANYTADVVIDSRTVASGSPQPLEIPTAAKFWERTVYISSSSKAFPTIAYPVSVATLGVSDGKIAGDLGDSGTIPADTTSTVSWGMFDLKCSVKATGAKACIVFANSLGVGQGENGAAGSKGGVGMLSRKLDEYYPSVVIARGGYYAQHFENIISGTAFPNAIAGIGATHVIVEVGLNDLSLGSRSKEQVMASRKKIIDTTNARVTGGVIPVHTTITPRVNSASGNYSSVADQSPKTDGTMAQLTDLNALIRAEPTTTPGSLVMDYADAAMSARDSNVFSGPFPPTNDGTHMLTAKVTAVAAAVNMPF